MGKVKAAKVNGDTRDGRVTKASGISKTDNKASLEKLAKEHAKKSKRAPTPESEDDGSESGSDASSASSSDSEAEAPKVNGSAKGVNGVKANGTNGIKAKVHAESDSDSTSDSDADENDDDDDDDDDDDEATPHTSKAAPVSAGKADGSDEDDDSEVSDGDQAKAGKSSAVSAKAADNAAQSDDESDEGSDDNSEGSDNDSEGSGASDDDVPAKAESQKKRKAESAEPPSAKKAKSTNTICNLFVGNLSWNVDEDWLKREFEEFGEIVGIRIVTDRESGRSRGFGYVEYSDPDAAATALEAKAGFYVDGRALNVDFSTPRGDNNSGGYQKKEYANDRAKKFGDIKNEPSTTLFVGNLSFEATADMVQSTFEQYGTVTRVSLPTDQETGAPKGFGYVDFASLDEATAAYEGMTGGDIAGRTIRLDYGRPRTGGGDRGGFRGGRGGGFGDRGGRGGGFRGGRGGFGDRGGRGGFNDRGRGGGRGNFSKNRGGLGDFSGKKVTF